MAEKAGIARTEALSPVTTNDNDYPEKLEQQAGIIDYSGAHEKTDPVEIRLVKKLDWYIMPT